MEDAREIVFARLKAARHSLLQAKRDHEATLERVYVAERWAPTWLKAALFLSIATLLLSAAFVINDPTMRNSVIIIALIALVIILYIRSARQNILNFERDNRRNIEVYASELTLSRAKSEYSTCKKSALRR